MNLFSGAIGGAIGGLIGAVAWAAIAYFFRVEVGYVAWAIGGLVGFGSALGTRGGSPASGIIAVAITVVAICAGKFLAIYLAISGELANMPQNRDQLSDEFCISLVADDICADKMMKGEPINWPGGELAEAPEKQSDYPPDIWQEAAKSWGEKDAAARTAYIDNFFQTRDAAIQAFRQQITLDAFLASFGFIDIIFFVLAIITAWRLAACDVAPSEPTTTAPQA